MLILGAAAPVERTIDGDAIVPITVNDIAGRMRIDPGAPGMPLLTADFAAAAGAKGGGLFVFGANYRVGTDTVHGGMQIVRLRFDDVVAKRRIVWMARPYAAGIDAVMGPAGVAPVVRFALRPPSPADHMMTLPMADGGWSKLYAEITVNGAPMRIRFDPHHPTTVANAGAASRLANAFDGRLSGTPAKAEIVFGIERPVRALVLNHPVAIGPLALQRLYARVGEGGVGGILEANAPDPDPDEIVVTAQRKHDPRDDRISLGADALARCSSIIFDRPARQIRLTCA